MADLPRDDGADDGNPLAGTTDSVPPDAPVTRWGTLELRAVLGTGAFGTVYRAWDSRLLREVALKVIKDVAPRQGVGTLLIEEARLLARIRHPNVVVVHGADEIDGAFGIWMELIEGRTLTAVLKQNGTLGAQEAVLIGIDVCRALAAVHKAGLIHRDVKADNIMREHGGRVVLMDFGAGTRSAPGGRATNLAGTPLYFAPEALAGKAATSATDIYSVGVLLYHLTTGRYPVNGRTIEELRTAFAAGQRTHIQDERPDLPAAFVRAVEGALEPDPARRFKTAGEMQAALHKAHDALMVLRSGPSPSTTVAVRPRPTARTRRARWVTAAVSIVLITTAAIFVARRMPWRATATPNSAALTSINSLAVLPFEVTSADPSEKYLASAVPVELITNFGQLAEINTIPWTFTKDLPSQSKSLQDVFKRTGADGVVVGSVQLLPVTDGSKNRHVRITVQLYQGRTGAALWSESFEGDVSQFMGMNTKIAEEIVRQIRVKLAVRRANRVKSNRIIDPVAMDLYLRARDLYLQRQSPQQLQRALDLFVAATKTDPSFAEAFGGVADSYLMLCAFYHVIAQADAYPKIQDATSTAIGLDPYSSRIWATRAYARFLLGWDWDGAKKDFERAALQPPDDASLLHDRHAEYLTAMGQHAEAKKETDAMVAAAPQVPGAHRQAGWSLFFARDYDGAIEHLKAALQLDPKYSAARTLLGRAYLQKRLYREGIAELESVASDGTPPLTMLAHAYAVAGQTDKARQTLKSYIDIAGEDRAPFQVAIVYVGLGELDHALDRLERAIRVKDTAIVNLNTDPRLDALRPLPRFIAMRRQLQFPE